MKIGFTGTREGVSGKQLSALRNQIEQFTGATELHHGDCVGADAAAHRIALDCGLRVVGHPPEDRRLRAHLNCHVLRDPLPYIARNHAIVAETDVLIATPRTMEEELRSGTWATIRYATSIGRRVILVFPNGSVADHRRRK